MKKKDIKNKGEIIIYQAKNGEIKFRGDFDGDTVWGTQKQIAEVFGVERSVITKHVSNIFKDGEVDEKVVCANFAHTTPHGAIKGKTQTKNIKFYNLDIMLAIGYRTNSAKATEFRKWATKILKQHLLDGYTINQKRLQEANTKFTQLQEVVAFLREKSRKTQLKGQESEILGLLADYSNDCGKRPKRERHPNKNSCKFDYKINMNKKVKPVHVILGRDKSCFVVKITPIS